MKRDFDKVGLNLSLGIAEDLLGWNGSHTSKSFSYPTNRRKENE